MRISGTESSSMILSQMSSDIMLQSLLKAILGHWVHARVTEK